jgi:hypothetical protein
VCAVNDLRSTQSIERDISPPSRARSIDALSIRVCASIVEDDYVPPHRLTLLKSAVSILKSLMCNVKIGHMKITVIVYGK